MKKIINGKKYDTGTATIVKEKKFYNYADFYAGAETLYRKRTGEFFVFFDENIFTDILQNEAYEKFDYNLAWHNGEAIMPISISVAKRWAERHMTGDEYEAVFGEVEE